MKRVLVALAVILALALAGLAAAVAHLRSSLTATGAATAVDLVVAEGRQGALVPQRAEVRQRAEAQLRLGILGLAQLEQLEQVRHALGLPQVRHDSQLLCRRRHLRADLGEGFEDRCDLGSTHRCTAPQQGVADLVWGQVEHLDGDDPSGVVLEQSS